jgi:hypothetical protein
VVRSQNTALGTLYDINKYSEFWVLSSHLS